MFVMTPHCSPILLLNMCNNTVWLASYHATLINGLVILTTAPKVRPFCCRSCLDNATTFSDGFTIQHKTSIIRTLDHTHAILNNERQPIMPAQTLWYCLTCAQRRI